MKKTMMDFVVVGAESITERHTLLRLMPVEGKLPEMAPGQFVQVSAEGVLLRRPISINNVDVERGELWLLVASVGQGTKAIASRRIGERLNIVLPLGRGFTVAPKGSAPLLIGGGVGVAPLLYLGKELAARGVQPTFLLGARTAADLLEVNHFRAIGEVLITTQDGSAGERGFVTNHSALTTRTFTSLHVCGPKPMMMAVARYAKAAGVECEVSLENMMACGLGACLCCVEKTTRGNVCVCTEGPVFNINELSWQI